MCATIGGKNRHHFVTKDSAQETSCNSIMYIFAKVIAFFPIIVSKKYRLLVKIYWPRTVNRFTLNELFEYISTISGRKT